MNETMIKNWNSLIQPNDIVYHLGDFAFGDVPLILRRLNGQIHLIVGSHDKNTNSCKHMFASYTPLKHIDVEGMPLVLCHTAMRVWHKSHYGSYHLYGHSHGKVAPFGKSFDCGVDTHNFFPYSWEEVKRKMNTLEDNFNLIKEGKRYGM